MAIRISKIYKMSNSRATNESFVQRIAVFVGKQAQSRRAPMLVSVAAIAGGNSSMGRLWKNIGYPENFENP